MGRRETVRLGPSLVGAAVLALSSVAAANDGWYGAGGAPSLLRPHRSVRMLDERIVMTVGRKWTDVEATFRFRNDGPTHDVRMGFPDEDTSRVHQEGALEPTVFQSFASWVDGKSVPTRRVRDEKDHYWNVKTVRMPRGKTVVVRNRYRLRTGLGRVGNVRSFVSYAAYTFRTGASWKGRIGKTELEVRFTDGLRARRFGDVDAFRRLERRAQAESDAQPRFRRDLPKYAGTVWGGSGVELRVVDGRLRGVRRNWRPTAEDDLFLWFDLRWDAAQERAIQGSSTGHGL